MSTKISQLTAATAPTGPESVPIVQSGNTVKATVTQIVSTPVPTLTASTSVVTPLVASAGATISFIPSGGNTLNLSASTNALQPGVDLGINLGTASLRFANLFSPTIDSGTTGSLLLKTNNGTTQLTVANDGTITPRVGYNSSDASPGIDTSITSAGLVGKTITVKDGLITAFA